MDLGRVTHILLKTRGRRWGYGVSTALKRPSKVCVYVSKSLGDEPSPGCVCCSCVREWGIRVRTRRGQGGCCTHAGLPGGAVRLPFWIGGAEGFVANR